MRTILLKNHKAFVKKHVVRDEYEAEETDTLAPYLQCAIEECEDFTFGDLWKLAEEAAEFYELVFRQAMGGFGLDAFKKDAQTEIDSEKEDPIKIVEVYRIGEITEYKPGKREMFIGAGFHGIGTGEIDGKVENDMPYSLSFSPISEFMEKPLRLNPEIEIDITEKQGTKYNRSKVEKCGLYFTVCDVLEAILDDITFYGEPTDRAARLAELDQTLESVKDGTAETFEVDLDDNLMRGKNGQTFLQ